MLQQVKHLSETQNNCNILEHFRRVLQLEKDLPPTTRHSCCNNSDEHKGGGDIWPNPKPHQRRTWIWPPGRGGSSCGLRNGNAVPSGGGTFGGRSKELGSTIGLRGAGSSSSAHRCHFQRQSSVCREIELLDAMTGGCRDQFQRRRPVRWLFPGEPRSCVAALMPSPCR